jgi:ABC-type multidrug transport system ATPase subunit
MSEESSQVILIAGPNGAGKTTLAPVLLRDTLKLSQKVLCRLAKLLGALPAFG